MAYTELNLAARTQKSCLVRGKGKSLSCHFLTLYKKQQRNSFGGERRAKLREERG
jgi:hypothetical protein